MDIGWRNSVDLEVCLFLGIFFSMYRKKPIILGYPFLLFSGDKYPLLGGGNSKIFKVSLRMFGEMIQFHSYFQMGWNHQLVFDMYFHRFAPEK